MKIAMLGYGKMGKAIEKLAQRKGHTYILKVTRQNMTDYSDADLKQADVAIEFSEPAAAVHNIRRCIELNIPVVSGTTGWMDQYEEVVQYCQKKNGGLFYASNFSIGVHLFGLINTKLSELMNEQAAYEVAITEIHHTQKRDAPSGTAITLAQQILDKLERKTSWQNQETTQDEVLSVISERTDQVPGTHKIDWTSAEDTIRLEHIAHSRQGFAKGALSAAEWIVGRKGVYGMKDLIGM